MELLETLVNDFQLLTNFRKNSIIVITEVLDLPLEYYNTFWICATAQIK